MYRCSFTYIPGVVCPLTHQDTPVGTPLSTGVPCLTYVYIILFSVMLLFLLLNPKHTFIYNYGLYSYELENFWRPRVSDNKGVTLPTTSHLYLCKDHGKEYKRRGRGIETFLTKSRTHDRQTRELPWYSVDPYVFSTTGSEAVWRKRLKTNGSSTLWWTFFFLV